MNVRPSKISPFRTSSKGMTLIEIMIVISIMSMLSLAIYNSLSVGIRVWKKSQEVHVEGDIAIFLDKLTDDLHNAYLYSRIPFEGSSNHFAFPAVVSTAPEKEDEADYSDEMGKVEYTYDVPRHAIVKREANYGQALKGLYGQPRILVTGVDRLSFQYLYRTDDGEKWSDQILDGVISGIDVEVVFTDSMGERKIKKSIDMPLGM